MNTFSLHGANAQRLHAHPVVTRSRGASRQKPECDEASKKPVAVIIGHPPYGSTEQQMLKRLMSSMKVRGSSCFDLRQLFLRECAWGRGGGGGRRDRAKRQNRGTDAMKWREGNVLPTTAGPPGSMITSNDSSAENTDNEAPVEDDGSPSHGQRDIDEVEDTAINPPTATVQPSMESEEKDTKPLNELNADESDHQAQEETSTNVDEVLLLTEAPIPRAQHQSISTSQLNRDTSNVSAWSHFPNPSPFSPDLRAMSSRATYPLSQRPILILSQLNENLARLEEVALDVKRKTYQRAHSLILKAMALTQEKSNWFKLAHRYAIMRGLQRYIGELIEENRISQNAGVRNKIHKTHHILQRLRDNWIRKDTLTEAQARTIVSRMNDSFDDVFRESGVLLLTGNPFLPDVEKEEKSSIETKSMPKRAGPKHYAPPRPPHVGALSREADLGQSLGNVCGQSAISPRPNCDSISTQNCILAGNEDRINIWMPQLPRLSSMSPPVPSPMTTTPHLLDIDINGRMRAAQRALSRVKRLPYPVNYATAIDLQQAHAAVAAVSVLGSASAVTCGGDH